MKLSVLKSSGCGSCRLCMGWMTTNPESPFRTNMATPTPDTGTLPGTALETLGFTFDADLGRDAIHLATIASVSDERLFAGQHVGLTKDGKVSAKVEKLIGIVDPFLANGVFPGQRFWLVLYPRTITGLRHVWTHPAFEDSPAKATPAPPKRDVAASEDWLRNFIGASDCPSYDVVMNTIKEDWDDGVISGSMDGKYLYFGGREAHGEIPPEFWEHVEVVLGHPPRAKPSYFSCSC